MNLSLRSGRLTILVVHFLTSRTLGRNPRVLSEKPAPLSVSFLFSSFSFFSHARDFSHAPFFSLIRLAHALYSLPFKKRAKCIFAAFSPCERIKISGCSFEFKSNLNSNANQLILIHSTCEKRGVCVVIQVVCPRPRGPRLRLKSIIHEGFMEALGLVGP